MTAIHRLSRSSITPSFFRIARWLSLVACFVVLSGFGSLRTQAQTPLRLGLLGDSGQDEYQGSDYRGGRYHAITFNWVEQLVKTRGIQVGAWGMYPEPRRTGFAANWSRSGATTASLIRFPNLGEIYNAMNDLKGLAGKLASQKDDAALLANSFIASVGSDGKVASNVVATLATALTGWASTDVRAKPALRILMLT